MTKYPMTKEIRMTKLESWKCDDAWHSDSSFELRHSFVIGYFVIRHCPEDAVKELHQ